MKPTALVKLLDIVLTDVEAERRVDIAINVVLAGAALSYLRHLTNEGGANGARHLADAYRPEGIP